MKLFNTLNKTGFVLFVMAAVWVSGCNVLDIKDRPDPNNTELQAVIDNPTRSNMNTLVAGTLSGLRVDLRISFINHGMIGREMYRFLSAEPRNTGDLLGKENSQLDPGSFYTTRPWSAHYANIRMANILIQAAQSAGALSQEEVNGVLGFANTIKAYEYLMALNFTNENGIRLQADDINTVGALQSKADGFTLIENLLDDAAGNLNNAEFFFNLPPGFSGFDDPAGFRTFNRALRARVAAYRMNDWQSVLDALNESFIDEGGDLTTGVFHDYTTQPNDQTNPVFADPQAGSGDSWVAHPSFVADAEAGDERVDEKVELRDTEASLDGLTSNYGLAVYDSPTAPVPMIRNAELILLRAEALINRNQAGDLDDAKDLLDIIRNEAGLADYSGATTQTELIDEMLNQRRYELFFEGHRWYDMRRYDRLDDLPLDRPGDNVWERFPIPEAENVN